MKFCGNCGKELRDGAMFCDACGTPVQEQTSTKEENASRKTVFEGTVHKCPNCGETLNSFVSKCPACGMELRDVNSSNVLKEFETKLSGSYSKDEKISIIRNFPIPNTKEDVLEFLILATSNVSHNMDADLSSAWKSKTEQAYQKANILFKNEPEFEHVQEQYNIFCEKINRDIKREKAKKRGNVISELMPVLPQFVVVFGWLLSIFILIPFCKVKAGFSILLLADLIAGAKFIPLALKCKSVLPKLVSALGLILSIIILAIICKKYNMGILLFVDVICSGIIFFNMLKDNETYEELRYDFNIVSFYIALASAGIFLIAYIVCEIKIPKVVKNEKNAPSVVNQKTDDNAGIYVYEIKDYTGRNLATVGEEHASYFVDEYGNDYVRLIIMTYDGLLIDPFDEDMKKEYTVVGQNIKPGSKLTQVHQRDSSGKPYNNLVDYQSYDEIVLYVSSLGEKSNEFSSVEILPVLDKHCFYIRDYTGRNAASFGKEYGNNRVDEYGEGKVKLAFTDEDGSYVEAMNVNELKKYIVVSQNINPNSEIKMEYSKDSDGNEYSSLVNSQSIDEINLVVRKLDSKIIERLPEMTVETTEKEINRVELTIEYKVLKNGDAEITGFSGTGNYARIERKIDGHEVVRIGKSAFKDCDQLEEISIGAKIEEIKDYAFAGCTSLKEISVPNETKMIGKHAFDGCTELTQVVLWGDPQIGDYAFAGCTSLPSISIGFDTESVGAHAFDGCTELSDVIVWNDDTVIGKDAFVNCPKLKDRPIQK